MISVLVIGYGNELRHDDGLGPAAVDALARRIQRKDCVFVTYRQPYPETVTLLKYASHVIFVDASIGETPGEISILPVSALDAVCTCDNTPHEVAPHHLTLEWLLWTTEQLYGCRPEAIVYTMTGQDFSLGTGISNSVMGQLPHFVAQIEAYIARCTDPTLN